MSQGVLLFVRKRQIVRYGLKRHRFSAALFITVRSCLQSVLSEVIGTGSYRNVYGGLKDRVCRYGQSYIYSVLPTYTY